jgi:hypothetical protein
MFRKILKSLWILQEVDQENKEKKLGRGFMTARRLNPFNPLSYIALIIIFIVALLMFGFVGMWEEMDLRNPFKWD